MVGVVIALPPWPFSDLDTFRKFSEDAVIIFTKPGMDGIHLGDVKLEEGDWKITGRDGYALVMSTVLRGQPALRLCPINPATNADEITETIARLTTFSLAAAEQ